MVSQLQDNSTEQDPRVRAVLQAAAAPAEAGPQPGEVEALATFRTVTSRRRNPMTSPLTRVRAAVAAGLGAGVLLAAGTGAAVAGVLPGAAQDTARTVLDRVGVQVPGADEHSAGHADQRGGSTQAGSGDDAAERTGDQGTTDEPTTPQAPPTASAHGKIVSSTARSTDTQGADHGKLVSSVASDGRARSGGQGKHTGAGQHTSDSTDDSTAPPAAQPADPGGDGRATAGDAGSAGKAKADAASGGRRGGPTQRH